MAEVQKEIKNLLNLNTEKINYDKNKNAIIANLENSKQRSITFDLLGDMNIYDDIEIPKYCYRIIDQYLLLDIELCGYFEPQKEDKD